MKHKIIPILVMPPRWRQDLQTGGGCIKLLLPRWNQYESNSVCGRKPKRDDV